MITLNEYDITAAFQAIENELIASMVRNMDRHRVEETREGLQWSMWQAEQIKSLEKYKRENQKKYQKQFRGINNDISTLIQQARAAGNMQQEISILNAIKNGFKAKKVSQGMTAEFFRLNDRKLEALIEATTHDMQRAETAILRMANDQYRKAIFNAQVYANSGAGTYEKAVDMATKNMLAAGLNCVQYANGTRHTLSDYADMAIRTASKRAYLQGEGEKRQEWGISTVIMNKRGNPCPKCLPFVGKVLIDDVWSGGKKSDGPYPLMSTAVAAGLYHPRCKDSHTTYFPGISTADDTWTREELGAIGETNKQEAGQQYAARQVARFGRLAEYSFDSENKKKYEIRAGKWEEKAESKAGLVDIPSARKQFVEQLRIDDNPSRHKAMMAMYSDVTEMVEDSELTAPFAYIPDKDVIKYNTKAPHIEDYDLNYVFAHETSHRMDVLEYHSWEDEKFLDAIEICRKKVYADRVKVQAWFETGGICEHDFAVSDIINALSDGEILTFVGHNKAYWERSKTFKPMELFADISSLDVLGVVDDEVMDTLEEVFQEYKRMVE